MLAKDEFQELAELIYRAEKAKRDSERILQDLESKPSYAKFVTTGVNEGIYPQC